MALTLAEAAKLSNDILLQGVIETIIKDSPVLQRIPFIQSAGNGLTYNREATAPSAAFFDVGDTWTESTPTFTQQTVTLKIMGGDADIDNFLLATRSNLQDLESAGVELKAKAVRQLFEQTFVTGDATANPKSFDGLDKVVDPAQSLSMGANGGSLTPDKLDELIRKVLRGKAHPPPPPPHHKQARPHLRLLPGNRPRRVWPDAPVLRRHPRRRLRLHLRRPDRRHQHRLLHHLRFPGRRGRPRGPHRPRP